uniref:GRIP1 associated protein 1 n=1 Tax=Gorilla gorilla gorilla TaxID=9595 RepID=G3S6Z2_GORGO
MAQALSEEEFQRMQAQLLELRTNNYQLSDELRKNGVELTSLRQKVAYLDKEFSKAQKALSKSKKAQEVEVLLSENEMLQAKLHSQEEDFRLQNSTLMAEFSKLCSQMEQLEQENQQLKEGAAGAGVAQAGPLVDGELLRLQAENTALQKNVAALQERYGKEAGKFSAVSEGQGDPPGGPAPTVLAPMPLAEVELKWEMEKEEKRLLWEQLQGLESSKQAETSRLQEELAKLSEKLKKKQESFCRLQTEKETLFNDSRNKIEELQQRKEADHKAQLARTQKLQQELEAANQSLAELRDQRQGERLEHAAALRALQDQIQTAKTQELNVLREQTTGLAAELQQRQAEYEDLMGQKDDLNSQLQESLQQQQQEQEEALKQCREQHAAELKGKEEELQDVRDQLEQAQEERDCHLKTISSLKQEVKDTVDGQRILEKKGSAALKDLKRQLHLERKRADKLQERLQDILTNSKSRSGLEELVLSEMNSPSRTQTGDSSSISSFSYREILREKESSAVPARSLSSSPQAQPPRPAELSDEEVAELFQRLAETQQEKWMLEEKVKHLEVSSASMAEDLCRKSAIIETYVMDSRIDVSVAAGHTDRSGLGSVLRDLVKPGDENLREMNKKLQNMLEEQLTKNMHLHKDMEVLSQEIVRLSKECVGPPDPDLEPGETS